MRYTSRYGKYSKKVRSILVKYQQQFSVTIDCDPEFPKYQVAYFFLQRIHTNLRGTGELRGLLCKAARTSMWRGFQNVS